MFSDDIIGHMGRIRQLDSQIANMIAAGEVVERPMGVVKELVENSIDAGSTRITVTIEEGGIEKITVEDNGSGMDAEDAQMSFQRHATSKIRTQNDLWNIHTLGFRGEALPSIASVAKVTMTTSDGEESTRVVVEYGKAVSVAPYPCNKGTEITVEGLFYRTPARLKHLRSVPYETSQIQNVISQFALSHPEIAFRMISSGNETFRTTGQGNLLEVVYQVFGRAAAENAVAVDFSDYDYHVSGYIVKPNMTRASRNAMHVFMNGRVIRAYRLYKCIMDGYEDFIVPGRFPYCVLNIEMDPHILDVNVHPSKWEVRLSKENQLEYLIRDNVRETLKTTMLAPGAEVRNTAQKYYEPVRFTMEDLTPEIKREEPAEKAPEEKPVPQPEAVREEPAEWKAENAKSFAEEAEEDNEILRRLTKESDALPVFEDRKPERQPFPYMVVIGQLHKRFILCDHEDGLAIIDQHAAQERVHYEEYLNRLNQNPAMTDLLVPITVHAGADLVSRVDEINESVAETHVVFEPFGTDTLIVRTVPSWMSELNEVQFIEDLVDNFRNEKVSKFGKMEKKKIATMACHHSIRFNRDLNMDEMREVVRQLALCENPYHCPHGRPTFVILDEKTLVKEFLR